MVESADKKLKLRDKSPENSILSGMVTLFCHAMGKRFSVKRYISSRETEKKENIFFSTFEFYPII